MANAAILLQNSSINVATTEVSYTFNDPSKSVWTAITTDASGNNRVMTGGGSPSDGWGGTGEMIVRDSARGYTLSNATGMPGDNYQTAIFVVPEPTWPFTHGNMVLFNYDGVEVSYDTNQYIASINGSVIGTFQAGAAGVMVQKMNESFSFWTTDYSADGNATTWTQRGTEVASASIGDDFSGLHLFVKPGGADQYWGYVGDFKVQSFAVPEPSAALLGGLGLLAMLRRRR